MHDIPEARTELRVERVDEGRADAFAEAFVRGYGTPASSVGGFDPQYVRANYLSSPEADTSGIA